MRLLVPTKTLRRAIVRDLRIAFDDEDRARCDAAVATLCRFYRLPVPSMVWVRLVDRGRAFGITSETGRITCTSPAAWKRNRVHHTRAEWVHGMLHELGHYVLWCDAERKAEMFARALAR